jgi:putative oxidoreductase
MKLATPLATLSKAIPLAGDAPLLIRFIGLSEVLGGIGLLLPAALRIKPHLTVLAAIGLAIVMLLALIFHLAKGEVSATGTNIVLGALAVFVAWGRARKVPIAPREMEKSFKLN